MTDSPLSVLFWIAVSLALAKFGPLLGVFLRH